jgi:hypothetical protein
MKELVLTIASKDYTVRLDDDFHEALSKDFERLFGDKTQLSVKDLLTALIEKCHDDYERQKVANKEMSDLLGKIGSIQ